MFLQLSAVNSVKRSVRRAGLTLIEAAMVLTILALVVGGVMLYYSSANSMRQTSSAIGQLAAIQQAIRQAYAGQSDYAALQQSDIINLLPQSMSSTGYLRNAFNGTIEVGQYNNGSQFSIEMDGIPLTACTAMSTTDVGRDATSLNINNAEQTPPPWTPALANRYCATSNTMVWYFF